VGLFYREGVFRQTIEDGQQTERYDSIDPVSVGASDTGIVVNVPFPGREVHARVWRIEVGAVPLLLLDTDVEPNSENDRRITDRLYAGSREHRLEQEMVLGVGGARALAAMGWDIELYHLNEGHAGFIILELVDRICADIGFERALNQVREGLVFTTHTPVPAGIDRFASDLIRPFLETWARTWDVPLDTIWDLGADPADADLFNMAALCLRSARAANGVSELHGEVSRKLFAGVGIGDDIAHVTNGVHARTWTATHIQELFDETLGDGWSRGESGAWERVVAIDGDRLLDARGRSSRVLADLIRDRTGEVIDPDALIIGFARRFAPYKRASLLLQQPERLHNLLRDDSRPVHFVFAGKAHPSDAMGKGLVAELVAAATSEMVNGRLTFIPDYEMDVAHALVQGADIWLNNPIRPREASGTSGEKAVLNGSLNCSVLDGWWAEMFDGRNGWEIPASESPDPEVRDREESATMLDVIGTISDEFHSARPVFLGRIRHAWTTLGPRVTAARMLRDYRDRVYRLP
jgi:starch phosphorylase